MSKDFIESIKKANNVDKHYNYIDNIAKTVPKELIQIFEQLPKDEVELRNNWQLRSAYDRIIESICLAEGEKQILCAFEIIHLLNNEKDARKAANLLTAKQNPKKLIRLVILYINKLPTHFINLINHELIARGNDLREYKDYYQIAYEINSKSIFHKLCLYPLDIEKNLHQRIYLPGISSYNWGFDVSGLDFIKFEKQTSQEKIIYFAERDDIVKVVKNCTDESNGKGIGIKGKSHKKYTEVELLMNINHSIFFSKEYKITSINSDRVFKLLFSFCANGGAYNNGEYGATARLYTWQSIHAMVSNEKMISNLNTEKLVNGYTWFEFLLDNWFYNELFDMGILAVNQLTNAFSLIAGTDVD